MMPPAYVKPYVRRQKNDASELAAHARLRVRERAPSRQRSELEIRAYGTLTGSRGWVRPERVFVPVR